MPDLTKEVLEAFRKKLDDDDAVPDTAVSRVVDAVSDGSKGEVLAALFRELAGGSA
jgi:hypothetical protein